MDQLPSTVRRGWHRTAEQIRPLLTGLHARVWEVTAGGRDYVATLVPAAARQPFEAGLLTLPRLGAHGIGVGAVERSVHGALTMETDDGVLALLGRPPGRPLDGADPIDARWWGDLLGAAHWALDGFDHPGLARWHGIDPDAAHLDAAGWVRPAVAAAVAAVTRLMVTDRLTYGVLHGDPRASLFVIDPGTGRTGVLGWGLAGTGPLVYDLAAAVVAAGGPEAAAELTAGYAAAGPVPRDEIDAALPLLIRFRWAAQADWCARRLADPACPDRPAVLGFLDQAEAALTSDAVRASPPSR